MLTDVMGSSFEHYFEKFATQTRTLTADLTDDQFWTRPYEYGNSIGHLVLHITGNLNYYVGAQIAGTGYVRNRPLEFTDTRRRPKEEVLGALDEAVAMVTRTVRGQSVEDWSRAYEATGSDDRTRFSIVLRCLAHFEHHVGQIIYLVKEQDPRQR
jgi:uncharacterized damage-inducible protein DinB